MDTEKRKKLQRTIQTAASLTHHQAGKVTGAVLTIRVISCAGLSF